MRMIVPTFLILMACSSSKKSDHKLAEEWHQKNIQLMAEVSNSLHQINEHSLGDSAVQFMEEFTEWKDDFSSLPNHDHSLNDHHHHEDGNGILTDQQLIELEKHLNQKLFLLQQRINQQYENFQQK